MVVYLRTRHKCHTGMALHNSDFEQHWMMLANSTRVSRVHQADRERSNLSVLLIDLPVRPLAFLSLLPCLSMPLCILSISVPVRESCRAFSCPGGLWPPHEQQENLRWILPRPGWMLCSRWLGVPCDCPRHSLPRVFIPVDPYLPPCVSRMNLPGPTTLQSALYIKTVKLLPQHQQCPSFPSTFWYRVHLPMRGHVGICVWANQPPARQSTKVLSAYKGVPITLFIPFKPWN